MREWSELMAFLVQKDPACATVLNKMRIATKGQSTEFLWGFAGALTWLTEAFAFANAAQQEQELILTGGDIAIFAAAANTLLEERGNERN